MWFFTAIIAKIAGASAVAQAATGAGIVLVGFTGAGMAGVLPNPVQHTFATVVSNVTPITPAGLQPAGTVTASSSEVTTSSEADPTTETATSAAPAAMPTGFDCDVTKSFGACVTEKMKDGTLLPGQVSAWARYYHQQRGETDTEQSDAAESDASESAASLSTSPQRSAAPSHQDNGHGQGSQHGNGHH